MENNNNTQFQIGDMICAYVNKGLRIGVIEKILGETLQILYLASYDADEMWFEVKRHLTDNTNVIVIGRQGDSFCPELIQKNNALKIAQQFLKGKKKYGLFSLKDYGEFLSGSYVLEVKYSLKSWKPDIINKGYCWTKDGPIKGSKEQIKKWQDEALKKNKIILEELKF